MFRPPYGRITRSQAKGIHRLYPDMQIIMWDVLSGDFDTSITSQACMQNVLDAVRPGSIIVFHDSEKAWKRLEYTLPRFLEYCSEKSWQLKKLDF
jgi:hypothetical protein